MARATMLEKRGFRTLGDVWDALESGKLNVPEDVIDAVERALLPPSGR